VPKLSFYMASFGHMTSYGSKSILNRLGQVLRLALRSGRFARGPAATAVVIFVSGCTLLTDTSRSFQGGCSPDTLDQVKQVDWSTATNVKMRIVDGDFRPMVMYLEQGRPYSLTVENAGREVQNFWAPDFLKAGVALQSVQIGSKSPARGCVNAVRIASRNSVTLRFVPIWEGRYEIRNSALGLIPGQQAAGIINIIQPRVGAAAQ